MIKYVASFGGEHPISEQEKARILAKEAETHRHLETGEQSMHGDIYGGEDWGFIFTIGIDAWPVGGKAENHGYRIRRKK